MDVNSRLGAYSNKYGISEGQVMLKFPKGRMQLFCGQPSKIILGKLRGVDFSILSLIVWWLIAVEFAMFQALFKKTSSYYAWLFPRGRIRAEWYLSPSMNCMNFCWPLHLREHLQVSKKKRKINKCLTNGLPRGQERVRRGSWACLELTEPWLLEY